MGNIFDPYPETVEYGGRVYRLNLEYDRVLRAVDIQSDETLTDEDKIDAQLAWLLADKPPRDLADRVNLLIEIFGLFPRSDGSGERLIDLHQDASIIRSAVLRGYGIDLRVEHPHYFLFCEMLADPPTDSALARTVELRARPIPEINKHNQKEVAALIKAKERVAIKISDSERMANFAAALKSTFNSIKQR